MPGAIETEGWEAKRIPPAARSAAFPGVRQRRLVGYASLSHPTKSSPRRQRRQGHQDRLDIATGLQPEDRAAVVEQVELHIAAAPVQLVGAVRLGPGLVHVAPNDRLIGLEETFADIVGEGEVRLPIA